MVTATPHRNYDISPDGKTFAMVRYNPATPIMRIQNLPALVRKLGAAAPGGTDMTISFRISPASARRAERRSLVVTAD
jgi:hypothetical protein